VINQSVVLVDLEPSPKDWSYHFVVCYLRLYSFVMNTLCNKALSFDITPICSHMCDLTFWVHICCVSSFVLKTRC
jgi:hypothetical protein